MYRFAIMTLVFEIYSPLPQYLVSRADSGKLLDHSNQLKLEPVFYANHLMMSSKRVCKYFNTPVAAGSK